MPARIEVGGAQMKITRNARLLMSAGMAVALLAASARPAAAGAAEAAKPAPAPASADALAEDGIDTVDAAKLLTPYAEWVRPLPGPNGHDYRYTTSSVYWSVVGVKPIGRTNVDLRLYDDKAHNDLLSSSLQAAGKTDFIAVDSNHRSFGGYYPAVNKVAGVGSYRIELAHGATQFDDDDEAVLVSSSDVVIVRDTLLQAGQEYVFGVGGVSGAILYLMGSNPDAPGTWVQPRSSALESTPVGGFQIFSYTPTRTDWYGVVVTLPGTAGEVTMIRETVD